MVEKIKEKNLTIATHLTNEELKDLKTILKTEKGWTIKTGTTMILRDYIKKHKKQQ